MKKIDLTSTERYFLTPLLKNRIEEFKASAFAIPAKYSDNLHSAFAKISAGPVSTLRNWEKVLCSGCVNERLDMLNQTIERPDAYSLLASTPEKLKQLEQIDIAHSILEKLSSGWDKKALWFKERTSYAEYLDRVNKLKRSDMIYLSGSNGVSPYKIGFVYDRTEFCVFELRQKIDLYAIQFSNIGSDAIAHGRRYFQMVLNRKQAFEKLSHFDESEYNAGQLPFLLQLLN
jgi:predicted DNA-binding protein